MGSKIPHGLEDYYFELPEELIARYPVSPRDASRLMILEYPDIHHDYFFNIEKYLPEDSLLVFNNTKVSYRRVYLFHGNSNKNFEVLFLQHEEKNLWKCLIRNGRKLKKNDMLTVANYSFLLESKNEKFYTLSCWRDEKPALDTLETQEEFFENYGMPPIPPYLKREAEEKDKTTYQTVFAEKTGSVAAPTASLHFTEELMERIKKKFQVVFLTLHIGYGTFAPLTGRELQNRELHEEVYEIPGEAAVILNHYHRKKPVVAVGTTVLRAMEDNLRKHRQFTSGKFTTKLFLMPPDVILSADYLITNFHLPASSLFLLVCAFGGKEFLKHAYGEAIKRKYRFYSYGDAMLIRNTYPPSKMH